MRANFDRALAAVLVHEGGYVDHPQDPGGATNLGVTVGTLSHWLGRPATKGEVKALTKAKVAPIYRKNYWDLAGCDKLPSGVDFAIFDLAVNSGVGRARLYVEASKNISDPAERIRFICARRMAFLRSLKAWPTFGRGWSRRVAGVELEAGRWAREPGHGIPPPPDIPSLPPAVPVALVAVLAGGAVAVWHFKKRLVLKTWAKAKAKLAKLRSRLPW
jgi:lysozyme family protein